MRAALLASALWAAPAFVEAGDQPADVASKNPDSIEEIVVTARFRTEPLQDTPIAISAISATAIENIVITDANSLQRLRPNV